MAQISHLPVRAMERLCLPAAINTTLSGIRSISETCRNRGDSEIFTLYLIRHGEASHNVLEKQAEQRALEQAQAEGLDSTGIHSRMEAARAAVLCDERLFDASLSENGRQEAMAASQTLQQIIANHQLPPPQEVLVSPLTRTLESANLMFPEHNEIHVREELRERCTGKPCDSRPSSGTLRSRKSFHRFSMNRLQVQSLQNLDAAYEKEEEDNVDNDNDDYTHRQSLYQDSNASGMSSITEEDKAMLRVRTRKLLNLLGESKQRSIAVVTHKGYLRELERGTFGKPLAQEFGNCEIRVYQIQLHNQSLDYAERIV